MSTFVTTTDALSSTQTYPRPRPWLERAEVLPGRSLTRSKAPGKLWPVGQGPLYVTHGQGAYLTADDGRDYLDLLCALGAISLGYGWPSTTSRVYSLPHLAEVGAAEAVLRDVAPWASHVRFTKTGSESTTAALLLAQRATGRREFWRLKGSYHGWHPWWQDDWPFARWFAVGEVPTCAGAAAVVLEPPRWEPFTVDWLRAVHEAAGAAGALVIHDEMIYGGRWALGGATDYFGVQPDLACFGKALGNGAPIACVVGRDVLRDYGELVSGTYSGHAGDLAAVVAVLNTYRRESVVDWLWARGRQLQRGLHAVCAPYPWAIPEGQPVHQRIRFDTLSGWATSDDLGHAFSAEMVKRGILWHPACTNVMRAHTEADIERVIVAAEASLRALADVDA